MDKCDLCRIRSNRLEEWWEKYKSKTPPADLSQYAGYAAMDELMDNWIVSIRNGYDITQLTPDIFDVVEWLVWFKLEHRYAWSAILSRREEDTDE